MDHRSGILLVDKPQGLTSFDVVRRVRRAMGGVKAGHTGTLDPLATGVLPVCLGQATRIAGLLLAQDKEYDTTAHLGLRTDTYDVTGNTLHEGDAGMVSRDAIERALGEFRGTIQQVPPAYSAVRFKGRRAYALAREGEPVALDPRSVTVYELSVRSWRPPLLDLNMRCSKGTYVRSLVADLGERLGCGAAVSALRRVRSGQFSVDECVGLEEVERAQGAGVPLLSIDAALASYPAVQLGEDEARRLVQGQAVVWSGVDMPLCRVRWGQQLLALGRLNQGLLAPRRVFVSGINALEGLE
jgi:tRNA pseudouridine55 synthase